VSRQPDFATQPPAARLPPWERVLLVAGALALAAVFGLAWRARTQAAEARTRLADVRRELGQQAARVRALAPRGDSPSGRTPASPARIVAAVAAVLPPGVRLERLRIDDGPDPRLELAVEARDAEGWDRLLERLEASPAFADVASGPESREAVVRSGASARWAGGAR
jgi:hypothetical protein